MSWNLAQGSAIQQWRIPVPSLGRPGPGLLSTFFPPGRSPSQAGCFWTSFPLSSGSFIGSSVLLGLETSANLSSPNPQRDPSSQHGFRLPLVCVKRRGGGRRGTSVRAHPGPCCGAAPSSPFSLVMVVGGNGRDSVAPGPAQIVPSCCCGPNCPVHIPQVSRDSESHSCRCSKPVKLALQMFL